VSLSPRIGSSPAAPLALVASSDDWAAGALASVLEPAGYRVLRAFTGAEAQLEVRRARPDIVLIGRLSEINGPELCRALRHHQPATAALPIVGVTGRPVSQQERLAWLRAEAWDVFGLPVAQEEFVLKLAAYLRAKRAADDAQEAALVDPATGLYNEHGVRRRASELVAEALRLHGALACVVFGLDPPARDRDALPSAGEPLAIRAHAAAVLRAHGRLSDTVGWSNAIELAILGPATDAAGAAQLAERLAGALEVAPAASRAVPALEVRAGYEAVADVHATPVESDDLLARASGALARARAAGRSGRIQRFAPGD
jgi:PleD family two-component response regulator